MFRFASIHFLWLILLLVAAVFFRMKRKAEIHLKTPSLRKMADLSNTLAVYAAKALPGLKVLALLLLIIALARPQWGEKKVNVTTEGINIILALDLSESMRALDFKRDKKIVTRLEAVKHVVNEFIMNREGDRIGLVVFGSNAYTQLPLTRDYNTIAFILDRLEIGAAGPRTAIGDAIGISLKRLQDIESRSNIIILLTDGESNSGELSWQDAARIAAGRNVKIYTIGVGSNGEAPFLVDGLFGQRYVYRNVSMDLDALKSIAEQTGASFFNAENTESLKQIYGMIDRLETTKVDVEKWVSYKELYPPFVWAGLMLLLIYTVISNTRLLRVP